jgi:hypothetical protein
VAGSLVYAGVFLLLGGMNERDRERFADIRRKLRAAWAERRSPAPA